jgi:hypothetical protein
MATRATLLNVVGMMIGTERSLSVQTAAMKVRWCVDHRFRKEPFPITIFFP